MKIIRSLFTVAVAGLVSFSALADNGKKGPQTLKVDTKASSFNWIGKKITGEHNGTINIQSGSLAVDGDKLVGGDFVIDINSIKVVDLKDAEYNAKLTGHLKAPDFFDAAKYPTASFKITKATPKGGANYDIAGNLTINGVTQAITFPATVSVDKKGSATATAKFEVDRTKFGSKYASKSFFDAIGDKAIHDNFLVDVKLVAAK
ncbi:YceI family protein [Emticicia sp. 21SJ11W-3]|uniref:YceI family protein n=1 Tax=Emticicia sp. 21SJ11W-3 TaxID=2916755 RepID=UPI00209C7956|nr:YceI family protein [Emticicia sp. 21SJ11W-3]UTA69938.1 YceI family protein [Emticicia sp. 21SJ11W-3]